MTHRTTSTTNTTTTTTTTRSAGSTRARLAREWARLATRPASIRTARGWAVTPAPPTSLDDVLVAVGAGGDYGREADTRLRRLVSIAHHDELAARVVIERIVPGLLAITRRYRGDHDAFEELLAAAWIAIRTYNPERSPTNIAAALLSDAEYAAYRRRQRRRDHTEPPGQLPDELADHFDRHPADELAELLVDARDAGMRGDDIDLVRLLVATPDTEELARRFDVTSRTIRNRRDRAITALRELALAS